MTNKSKSKNKVVGVKATPAKPTREEIQAEDLYTETPAFTEPGYLRREEEMDWDYNPDGDLEISEELAEWFREQGYATRWARHTKEDKFDSKNIAKNRKKGYEFAKLEQLPAHVRERFEGEQSLDGFEGLVAYEDLVLMIAPLWKNEIVKDKLTERATRNLNMVDDLLQRRMSSSGLANADPQSLNLINDTKRSRIAVGGTREVNYSKRAR